MEPRLERFKSAMVGGLIGDALGWPYETKQQGQFELVRSPQGMLAFTNAPEHDFEDMRTLPAGSVTDDTQRAQATARSLIRRGEVDPFDLAGELIGEYARYPFGYGKTSISAINELKEFFESYGRAGRRPDTPPALVKGLGGGNGVAGAAYVIGLYYGVQDHPYPYAQLSQAVLLSGFVTHANPNASFAAFALACLTAEVLKKPVLQYASEVARPRLHMLGLTVANAEDNFPWEKYGKDMHEDELNDNFSQRIGKLMLSRAWKNPVHLREEVGTGCYALESTLFAIVSFLRHPLDFEAGMEEVIAAGGDTDSNAAMYGALAGANGATIPKFWREHELVRDKVFATEILATELYNAATKK